MRSVLLLHSSAEGYGSDRQLHLIATGLDPARYRARVVLPYEGPLAGRLREAGVPVAIHPLAVLRRNDATPRGALGLARRTGRDARALPALAGDAALVHANTSVVLVGALATRRLGVPALWHLRETYAGFGPLWPAWRAVLERTGEIACISASVRSQLTPGARARVLPDGIVPLPGGGPGRAEARADLGLPLNARVVALPARLSGWKGQDVLLEALARTPGTVALLAGSAWHADTEIEPRLRALATSLGVADRVRFLGFRDPLAPVLAATDVVVVPSTRPEPLGNAALEAALAGRPVVAAAHGGLAESFTHDRTALLVPPGDAAALAAALARLEAEPGLGPRLAAAARADVAARFAPERFLAALQDLYDDLTAPSA